MAWSFGGWRRQAAALTAEVDRDQDLQAQTREVEDAKRAGYRRAFAQGVAAKHRNHYNAAKKGRRTDKWGAKSASPNVVTQRDGKVLRSRARHQVRNSPHAAKAKAIFVSSVVGDGIRPQIKTGDEKLDQLAESLWAEWSASCDADGRHDFYGLQRLIASTVPAAGGCLVRRRPRRMSDGLPVPLQLQVMEVDHLDDTKTEALRTKKGKAAGRVVQGVEFDAVGRRKAYWLFPFHPHDVTGAVSGLGQSKRVPAAEIAHVYHCDRPGQATGLPWLAPIMMLLEDLEAYMDAEVLRKRVEACMVGIFKGDRKQHLAPASDTGGVGVEELAPITDVDGVPMGDIQPGEFYHIDSDAELTIHTPTVMSGIEEFVRVVLRQVATGLGMTYELLAGDLSKVNFSSGRMGNIQWRRHARALRQVLIVRQFCEVAFRWWLIAAIASGKLPDVEYQVEWIAPHFEEVDREKDLKADILGLASGLHTFSETVKRRGKDLAQHAAALASERELLAELGISVDWSAKAYSSTKEEDPEEEGKKKKPADAEEAA